ncbi:hypothetical protein ACHAXS_012928 [Conticribra weissflogii]
MMRWRSSSSPSSPPSSQSISAASDREKEQDQQQQEEQQSGSAEGDQDGEAAAEADASSSASASASAAASSAGMAPAAAPPVGSAFDGQSGGGIGSGGGSSSSQSTSKPAGSGPLDQSGGGQVSPSSPDDDNDGGTALSTASALASPPPSTPTPTMFQFSGGPPQFNVSNGSGSGGRMSSLPQFPTPGPMGGIGSGSGSTAAPTTSATSSFGGFGGGLSSPRSGGGGGTGGSKSKKSKYNLRPSSSTSHAGTGAATTSPSSSSVSTIPFAASAPMATAAAHPGNAPIFQFTSSAKGGIGSGNHDNTNNTHNSDSLTPTANVSATSAANTNKNATSSPLSFGFGAPPPTGIGVAPTPFLGIPSTATTLSGPLLTPPSSSLNPDWNGQLGGMDMMSMAMSGNSPMDTASGLGIGSVGVSSLPSPSFDASGDIHIHDNRTNGNSIGNQRPKKPQLQPHPQQQQSFNVFANTNPPDNPLNNTFNNADDTNYDNHDHDEDTMTPIIHTPNHPSSPSSSSSSPSSPPTTWTPQTHTSTCEFTHTITSYSQKRDSGCKKAEYSNTTIDSHGNKWRLIIYVNGNGRASNHHLSLFLQVADAEDLPFGWNKAVSYVLTLEHPHGPSLGYAKRNPDKTFKMCPKAIDWGWSQFITSDRIQQEGYVHQNSLTVRASVTVKSSSVNIDPEDAELYLKCAVEEGNPEAVRICLAQDARVNCQFKDDLYTPLHTACSANGEGNNGNGGGGGGGSGGSAASGGSNGSGGSSSTNNGNNLNGDMPGPIAPGSLEVLHLLLERGADVNACNKWRETPLLIAANNGHVEAVKALLDAGADPSLCSEAGWSALTFAAHKGYDEIVGLLLAAGAPVNCRVTEDLSTPLHKACAGGKPGHLSSVQQLLEGNADVHALNKWRETPLLTAANHGQSEAVEALLAHGADPCKCTDTGWSPLSIAAYKGHDDVVRLLLEEGAPTEEADPTLSALLQAATKGLPDTVMLLLRHGADHTVTTKKGDTALAILVEQNLIDAAVEMVTDYNASIPRCSRDRKKVQRARLLINLRLKQMHRDGDDSDMSDDDSDPDESDSDQDNGAVALHTAGGIAASPLTSGGSRKKSKKKIAPPVSTAKAEADARAAEEALLLEIEAEEKKKIAASESKSNKKKKKKKDRDRQQKADKSKEDENEKQLEHEEESQAKEESKPKKESPAPKPVTTTPIKKEKVIELNAKTIAAKKSKEAFVHPQSKQKKDSQTVKVKEVSLPSSQPTQPKKQAEPKLNLKWAENTDTKTKAAAAAAEKSEIKLKKVREVSLPKAEPKKAASSNAHSNNNRSTKPGSKTPTLSPKKTPGDKPKVPAQTSRSSNSAQPTLQPKVASPPAQRKRGWENKSVPPVVAPGTVVTQPNTHSSKPAVVNARTIKEPKPPATVKTVSAQNAKNKLSSSTPKPTKISGITKPDTDTNLLSASTSLPPTHSGDNVISPIQVLSNNAPSKQSVDDQLANMANDVLGFLDFDPQPSTNSSSFQDFSAGGSVGNNEGFQHLPGYGNAANASITPPPQIVASSMSSTIGRSSTVNTPEASTARASPFNAPISVELPAVSLFRLEKLQTLFHKCAEARSSPNNPLRVVDEHTLRLVIYRWIIRASHGSESFLDPVIPSWEDEEYLRAFLQRQFISENRRSLDDTRYNSVPSIEVLREAGAAMSELCTSLANDVTQFRNKCEQQVPQHWSDADINVTAMEENGNVVINWAGASSVTISFSTFASMSKRYIGEQNRLMSSVFSAVRRHEIINAIAEQTYLICRLPPQILDCLSKGLGANLETWTDSVSVFESNFFCAMFPDVDSAFGGLVPFGKENGGGEVILNRAGGSAVVVAPPENATSSQYIRTMIDMVESSKNVPLSFSVILCSDCFVNPNASLSADDLMSLDPRLCNEQNGFISYVETFPAGSSSFSNSSSMFILMQNESGKIHFPPHPTVLDSIRRAMRSDTVIHGDISMMSNYGMTNDAHFDATPSFSPLHQPQYTNISQDNLFASNPFAIGVGNTRGRGHRGRLFELVGEEETEEDQGMSILPGMLNNFDMSMFSSNTQDEVDIEAISLMGIGGHALHGNMGNHNNS